MTIDIRTPYNQRSTWMQEAHRKYGNKNYLQDVDMWIEGKNGLPVALAEFKQDYEQIELWKCKPLIHLADKAEIPCYVVVGCQKPYIYYAIIPLNDACKKIPSLAQPRYFSEKNYSRFLSYLRKEHAVESEIESLNNDLPPKDERFIPNVK